MNFAFRKKLVTGLIIFPIVLLLGIAAILWIGSEIVLHPKRRPLEERHHTVNANPSDYGMVLEKFSALTHDQYHLRGFLVHPEPQPGEATRTRRMRQRMEAAGVAKSGTIRGTVLLLHGRGGKKEDMLTVAQRFVAADFRCVVYDARAHGESGGTICTFGKLERQDVRTVLDQVEGLLTEKGENIGPVVAFGNSLGAAVMLQTIPEEPRILAGVASAPFADMMDVVIHAIGNLSSHRIPQSWRAVLVKTASVRGGFSPQEIVPERSAAAIQIPVFVVHGERDRVIPIQHAERIFKNLPEDSRKWQEIPGAYHHNLLAEGGDDLYEAMIHFYLDAIRAAVPDPPNHHHLESSHF